MIKESYRRLNLTLSTGLCVLNVKFKKSAPVATAYVTDFNEQARILLDVEGKRLLVNKQNIDIPEKDIQLIFATLAVPEKKD